LLALAQSKPGVADSPSLPERDTLAVEDTGASTRRIGRYKLLEIIGEGGFGTVWMAEQQEPVHRRVALKVIKLGMDTRQVVARFQAERQALALMDHPSIARVFDAGATEAGRPFFVMELVRGVPITEFCDARRLNSRERLELFIPICQAVQHAHQKGVIHRDLKPSNILVTEQDGRAVAKIIDFGVAKAIEEPLTDKTLFTRFHQFLGTPAYMSPEQAGLGGLDVDTRSDIYSLGVLLYELLTGQPPLDPRQLREAGCEAILKTIREVEPTKPSTQLRRRLVASRLSDSARARVSGHEAPIDEDLDWIVLKALEKDRARRYESANGLAADLRRYLANEPITARPPSNLYRLQKLARRHKLAFGAAGATAATLVLGLVATAWQTVQAKRHLHEARLSAYAAEMKEGFDAWEAGRVVQARDLLKRQRPRAGSSMPDLRGFEWRYLWSVTQPTELLTLTNVTSWGFAISPDGQMLAGMVMGSGEANVDWRLRLWSLPEQRPIATLPTNSSFIFNAAFSPDGRHFATPRASELLGTNSHVQVWDAEERRLVRELPFGPQPLGMAFSPDGRILAASGGGDMYLTTEKGQVRFWDAATGVLLRPPLELPQWAYQVAFSPDSQNLAVSCGDGVARVLGVPDGQVRAQLTNHSGFVAAVAFTHDGARLVTGDERGYVRIWDWVRGYPETIFKAHDAPIYQISITTNDQRLATASRDFTARLWDRHTAEELARFAGHNGGVTSVRFLPGDQALVTGSQDRNIKVWSAHLRKTGNLLAKHPDFADPRFISGGRYVALVSFAGQVDSRERSITFFNAATGIIITNVPGIELAVSQDGKQLAILGQTNLLFYDPVELTEVSRMDFASSLGGRPCFSPDGRWLAFRRAASDVRKERTQVIIWDVSQRRVVAELQTDVDGEDGWAPLFFARGGRLLLTTRLRTQRTSVWDTSNWQRVKVFNGPPSSDKPVVALSPDGRTFGISGIGGQLYLWDLEHLTAVETVNLRAGDIFSLAFDPEGRILAAGAIDGTIRLWSLPARQEVASLRGHSSLIHSLEFSPDHRALASGSRDFTIRLWRAPSWEEIRAAEAAGNRAATD
jgi:WD40 repeat protein/serine/threonine protein kinase